MNDPVRTPAARAGLRLLLINPTIVDKREHLHIGLGTIGTFVRTQSRHEARVLDFMACRHVWRERLAATLRDYQPDLVGFYIATPYFPAAREIAAEVKRLAPSTPVLAGGHHATLAPDEVIADRSFDMLIVGEGEKPIVRLLDVLEEGQPLEEVAGLWFRDGGAVHRIPKDTLLESPRIPSIDWSVFDEETLRANFYYWGVLPVMGSRGCPARCSFCSITNVQKLYSGERFLRFRDPVEVVDEVEQAWLKYRDYGMRVVYFYDLNFLVNVPWLRRFTDEYKRRGLNDKVKWSAYTRADHVVPAAIECLKDSGCVNLRVGIEAANPYMRNVLYEKDVPQPVLLDALHQIKSIGISITGYFMAGGPGERPEWLMESLELAWRSGVEFPAFFLYKPLAGTNILDRAEELGSRALSEGMASSADFLHGVQMEHAHIKAWQLKAYLLLTHVLFGPNVLRWQARRARFRYPVELVRYVRRAMKQGFTLYGAFTYFIFYGSDHLEVPLIVPERPRPGSIWRALMAVTRLWMRHSGQPEPQITRVARGASRPVVPPPEPLEMPTSANHGEQAASSDAFVSMR